MKTLKFQSHLVPKILDGTKTITWRFFDDKNLQVDDLFSCVHSETSEIFALAKIVRIEEKPIKDLSLTDLLQNGFTETTSIADVVDLHKKYYGDKVDEDVVAKIISFKI